MELLCDCKRRSIAEGLDYEEYDFRLEDLPDIRVYAEALVTGKDVLTRLQRKRRLVTARGLAGNGLHGSTSSH
jgi:hypothetical protein